MIQYEFVASAISFAVDPANHRRYPSVVAAYKKFFTKIKSDFPEQRFSMLFNAFIEPHDGNHWRKDFTKEELTLYSDSGGLQMITIGKEITEAFKQRIYKTQGSSSDYAMIFDEIPAITNGGRHSDTHTRLFDPDAFDGCARKTANNVREQIDYFAESGSDTKPLLILQGNDMSWYQKWLDICLSELDDDHISKISGIAFGTPVYGNGLMEDVERLFLYKNLEAPDHMKKHLHLLGVGSMNRFVVAPILRASGVFPTDVMLSYDSSKLTGGTRRGEYHYNHKPFRVWRHDPAGIEMFERDIMAFCKDYKLDFDQTRFRSSLLHSNFIREANGKTIEPESLAYNYLITFMFSAYNFMKDLDSFRSVDYLKKHCDNETLLSLLNVTTDAELSSWKLHAKNIKSQKVASKVCAKAHTLEEFFA